VNLEALLARKLVAAQLPAWADLPIHPVEPNGHGNRTFGLGSVTCVPIPSQLGHGRSGLRPHDHMDVFSGESRAAFRQGLALDRASWTRARGAIWKALITIASEL
jgi:hypothetical protein